MEIKFSHLRYPAINGKMINFAVFDAKSTTGHHADLLADLTFRARNSGLKIDQSALVFSQHGRIQFYGDRHLVDFLSKNWHPQWTHTLTI